MNRTAAKNKLDQVFPIIEAAPLYHNGLMSGGLGLCYFYYYASLVFEHLAYRQKAETMLFDIFESMNVGLKKMIGPAFGNGAAGLAFVVNDLAKMRLIDFDIENEFEDLDSMLFEWAAGEINKNNMDFLHGAMGIWHYFVARKSEGAAKYLNQLADLSFVKVHQTSKGSWFPNTGIERLTEQDVDFGLAHGQSGFLLLMMEAFEQIDNKAKAASLIESGLEFLKNHEKPPFAPENSYSQFPMSYRVSPIDAIWTNRLAWCYGDLNQSLVFYRAWKLFDKPSYYSFAEKIGLNAIARTSKEATTSEDTHFCHGHAGLAQFYKALYKESGNELYLKTYYYWIAKLTKSIEHDVESRRYRVNPVSLLEGWTGVAFVLLDYLSQEEMNWCRIMLL